MTSFAMPPEIAALSIAAVERETGLAKDTLRVWEKRYGFPAPLRDAAGDRLYPSAQVVQLKLIRRLSDWTTMRCKPCWRWTAQHWTTPCLRAQRA